MANIIKLQGTVYLSSATVGTNVGLSKLVKVLAGTAGDLVLSTANKETEIARLCMTTGETAFIQKNATDELSTSDLAASWKFSPVSLTG